MPTRDLDKLLRAVPLFQALSVDELSAVARLAYEVAHDAGETIVDEGTDGLGFYLVLEGQASVTKEGAEFSQLGPGDFFGEIALIDGRPRSATVTATTPVRLAAIATWNFKRLLDVTPVIAERVRSAVEQRLQRSERSPVA